MQKKVIIGNWKMNGTNAMAASLVPAVCAHARDHSSRAEVVFAPPFTHLALVREMIPANAAVKLAAQDCSEHAEGAHTGEVSAGMLKESGCSHVIIGHSERRTYHKEGDALIHRKMKAAIAAGLIPVICVGELLAEREKNQHKEVVGAQLKESVLASGYPEAPFIVAYEPVWAIGTGKTATSQDITEMHKHIASVLSSANNGSAAAPVLYGGSVKAANAKEILSLAGVDGVLVGGASLKPNEFNTIISAAA